MNDLPSCVRAKKLLLISDACAAAGFTFFALHPILGVRPTKDRPRHPLQPFPLHSEIDFAAPRNIPTSTQRDAEKYIPLGLAK